MATATKAKNPKTNGSGKTAERWTPEQINDLVGRIKRASQDGKTQKQVFAEIAKERGVGASAVHGKFYSLPKSMRAGKVSKSKAATKVSRKPARRNTRARAAAPAPTPEATNDGFVTFAQGRVAAMRNEAASITAEADALDRALASYLK